VTLHLEEPMAIDIEKIKQRITEIKENIEKIKKYSSISLSQWKTIINTI
jgi:hypothetical protein